VLIIDDSLTVLKQLQMELQKLNIHADCAETGEEGLTLVSNSHYDMVFLDIVLPATDGYMICKCIRKNPHTKHTPVVMLSSKSSTFDKVRGKLVGCDEYLTKPVDYKAFHTVVDKYVIKKHPPPLF
jgi:twitching motility two-component system response regulator PilG